MLLETLGAVVATGEVERQHRLFAAVELQARSAGHGSVLDSWGDDLRLMHSERRLSLAIGRPYACAGGPFP